MGFWYFLALLLGSASIAVAVVQRRMKTGRKWAMVLVGMSMIAFALFMFQDGSAEIVDSLLTALKIDL